MGVVFRARDLSLNREVALKVLQSGVAAKTAELRRFQMEAEAVARLQHEHIAQIFQVGEHQGQAFLALELVPGPTLNQWTAAKPIPAKKAAHLLWLMTQAVQYAHGKGVVHRDLKPHNILLAKEDQPKIVDFGLAKDLDRDSSETKTGSIMGTPSYMAPEQAKGQSHLAGPLADVYSLGAILYYLITGRPPFQAETAVDTIRQVLDTDPLRPQILNPKVDQDLQTICLKCLQKDPQKRYRSAADLAEDLNRFLSNRPIIARPIGRLQQAGRWCRRNPRVASLSLALLTTVLLGTTGILIKWQEAETQKRRAINNLAKARQTVDEFYVEISENELLDVEGLQPLRETLLRKALLYYQEFLKQKGDTPEIQRQLATTWHRVGRLHWQLGSVRDAIEAQKNAALLYEKLLSIKPQDPRLQLSLVEVHVSLANVLLGTNQQKDGLRYMTEAIKTLQELHEASPKSFDVTNRYVTSLIGYADAQKSIGETASAIRNYTQAGLILDQFLGDLEGNQPIELLKLFETQAGLDNQLGLLQREQGQLEDACEHFRMAIDSIQQLTNLMPDSLALRQDLAGFSLNLANAYDDLGDPRARNLYKVSTDRFRKLYDLNPESVWYQHYFASALSEQGIYELNQGRLEEAGQLLDQSIQSGIEIIAKSPDVIEFQTNLANAYLLRGAVAGEAGQYPRSREVCEQAVALLEKQIALGSTAVIYQELLCTSCHNLSRTLVEMGKFADAERRIRQAIQLRESLCQSNPESIENRVTCVDHYQLLDMILTKRNDRIGSEKTLTRVIQECEALLKNEAAEDFALHNRNIAFQDRARVRTDLQKFDGAISDWNRCIDESEKPWSDYYVACRARTLALSGKHAAAWQECQKFAATTEGLTLLTQARALGVLARVLMTDAPIPAEEREPKLSELCTQTVIRLTKIHENKLLENLGEQLTEPSCKDDLLAFEDQEEFLALLRRLKSDSDPARK